MKEDDYLVATNLARLQIVADVLHRIAVVQDGEEEEALGEATRRVSWLLQRYYYRAEHGK